MKKHIDKIFLVLGGVAFAVFNAVIPNIFFKKTEDFVAKETIVRRIDEYKGHFKKPEDIPTVSKLEEVGTQLTHSLFTVTTFQYKNNLAHDEFTKKICEKIAECEIFLAYAPYGTVTITTQKPPEITQPKEPKCGKPSLELKDNIPGKIILKITPGVIENAILKGFEVYRNDIKDEKGEMKVYLFLQPSELEKIDDKVEPDIEYSYSIRQVCNSVEEKQKEVFSESSEEKKAIAKRRFYITCYNNAASSVSLKINVKQYEDDGSEKEGKGFVKKGSEIEVLSKGGGKISTGLTLVDIFSKAIKVGREQAIQRTIKYCRMDVQKGECEENTITSLDCIFEPIEAKKPPEEEKGEKEPQDKKNGSVEAPKNGEKEQEQDKGEKK